MTNELHPGEVLTAETVGLLPCPFCGSSNVDPEGWRAQDTYGATTQGPICDDCDATAASVAAWNSRPSASDEGRGSRPSDVPTEGGATAWEEAADGLCAEMLKQAPGQVRKVSEALYETLLDSVQDYLRENVAFNLSADLARANRKADEAFAAFKTVAEAIGVETEGGPNYPTPTMISEACLLRLNATHPQEAASVPGEGLAVSNARARLTDRLAKFSEKPGGHWIWKPSDIEAVSRLLSTHPAREDGPAGQWQDIATANRGKKVLINDPRWGVTEGLLFDDGMWGLATFNGQVMKANPTHWMPLPAAPTKEPA